MTRTPALDGLRALAIGGVLVVHANPGWMPGGGEGVTVFFVLSGFLITSLLLAEHEERGRVDLVAFYVRRAARLLPALLVVVEAIVAFKTWEWWHHGGGLRVDHELVVGAASVLGYCSNLVMSLGGHAYAPFAWSWSLAIEEQFYLLWPALLLWRLSKGGRGALPIAAAGVLLATAERVRLVLAGRGGIRVEFGTDTRLDAILLGCVLALMFTRPAVRGWFARYAVAIAPVGLVLVAAAYAVPVSGRPYLHYLLMLPAAEVGAALLVGSIAAGGRSVLLRPLAWRPVVYVGGISYGIYLWNLLLRDVWAQFFGFPDGAAMLGWIAFVVVVSAVCSRFLEQRYRKRAKVWVAARSRLVSAGPVVVPVQAASAVASSVQ